MKGKSADFIAVNLIAPARRFTTLRTWSTPTATRSPIFTRRALMRDGACGRLMRNRRAESTRMATND